MPHRFDKYIFCDAKETNIAALKQRCERIAPDADITFIVGDSNVKAGEIIASIPRASATCKVLSLCVVDPYNLEGIKFKTIEQLSKRFIDFFVLLMEMDASMNRKQYIDARSTKVADLLGDKAWREKWKIAELNGIPFTRFVFDEFGNRMCDLEYLPTPEKKFIRSTEKNLLLYQLAIFSRNKLAYKFWNEGLNYGSGQPKLPGLEI